MSAFVVDTECMDRVVRTICARSRYDYIVHTFAGISTEERDAPTQIGRRLFTLNIEAVTQRYPDCEDEPDNLPGTEGCAVYPRIYRCEPVSTSPATRGDLINGYKAIRCLVYQCSEGDVPERAELYRELERAAGRIAGEIVSNLPEYDAASWG